VSGNTDNADLRYQLGLLARQLGREDLAVSWFTAALAIDPTHTDAQSALRLADATASGSP
jgi:tetratricopeptide (TPR) repeat protein